MVPAKRPGGRPDQKPDYRVLVHRKYLNHWTQIEARVGTQQAQQFWDHVSSTPGATTPIASTSILRGKAGRPMKPGWSRTYHYELSGAARVDYQFHNGYKVRPDRDAHPVVAILTISYSSH